MKADTTPKQIAAIVSLMKGRSRATISIEAIAKLSNVSIRTAETTLYALKGIGAFKMTKLPGRNVVNIWDYDESTSSIWAGMLHQQRADDYAREKARKQPPIVRPGTQIDALTGTVPAKLALNARYGKFGPDGRATRESAIDGLHVLYGLLDVVLDALTATPTTPDPRAARALAWMIEHGLEGALE